MLLFLFTPFRTDSKHLSVACTLLPQAGVCLCPVWFQ